METAEVQTQTPVESTTPETPAPAAASTETKTEAPLTLTQHQQEFPTAEVKERQTRERDESTGRFVSGGKSTEESTKETKPERRHRERDVARPDDVPRIRELTAKVRDLEARLNERANGNGSAPRTQTAALAQPAPQAPVDHWAFPKPEPKLTDPAFAMKDDPYAAWLEARQDWRLEKRDWETSVQQQAAGAQEHEQAFWGSFDGKLQEFAQNTPDYSEVFSGDGPAHMREDMPPAMVAMIFMDDNPGKLMYDFARDPALFDEVASWSAGIHIPPPSASEADRNAALVAVSRVRRMIDRRSSTGSSGTVAPPPTLTVAPPPAIPLRTGPMKTGDEPPGDGHGLKAHIKAWPQHR